MDEPPPKGNAIRPMSWARVITPLIVVLVLATRVSRRDLHLSWSATALVLVGIVGAEALWWRFATHKLVPWLVRSPRRTWQTRSGHFKMTLTCKSCGNSMEMTGGQGAACPSCGEEIGHTA
jgi:hypothetical protein